MSEYPGSAFDLETARLLAPADYVNPEPKAAYHVAVVGAGPAGLITAIGAAGLGASVALIEKHRMGGDCLNVGCVPSKALLEYTAHHPAPTFDQAFAWLREVRASIAPHDSVARYSELGVDVFLGSAQFDEDGSLNVDGRKIDAKRIALCTGASPAIPPIPGLREADPLTNETVFDLTRAPQSIAILGAGAIGCELAQVFARLGITVHLFELADRVLPLEVPEASAAVAASLADLGVAAYVGQGVERVESDQGAHIVHAGAQAVRVEQIIVALGRSPNTRHLQVERVGVKVDDKGLLITDAKLRTTNKKIYAAGDCTAKLQFTHHADAQARALVQNTLFAPTAKVGDLIVPHCTYTQPEVASVGQSPDVLAKRGIDFDTYRVEFEELDRGRAEIDGGGFAVVWTQQGRDNILGATIVGHDAGEQIAAICLLMTNKLGLGAVQKTLLAYPTRSEYLKRLSDAYNRTRLTPFVARAMQAWLKFRL